jgi:hypothetical protein
VTGGIKIAVEANEAGFLVNFKFVTAALRDFDNGIYD